MPLIHAESYKGLEAHKFIHKARLKKIISIFNELRLGKEGAWGDFGCSDGFYFGYLREKSANFLSWKLYGFDHEGELLDLARKRNIPNSEFVKFDLNKVSSNYENLFEVVTCFETLEHTGNYKNAFENIHLSCKPGGIIILSVPNEIGFPGIAKFIGRKLLRKNPYESFFENSSEFRYLAALLKGEDIEAFRDPGANGWGPHLGFNYKNFEKYILEGYIKKGNCDLVKKYMSFFGFNILYVLKKTTKMDHQT